PGQPPRDAEADAAVAAGHDGHAAGEVEEVEHSRGLVSGLIGRTAAVMMVGRRARPEPIGWPGRPQSSPRTHEATSIIMPDPRWGALAEILISHSTRLAKGELIFIEGFDLDDTTLPRLLVQKAAQRQAGALVELKDSRVNRELIRHATEPQ